MRATSDQNEGFEIGQKWPEIGAKTRCEIGKTSDAGPLREKFES